MPEGRLLGGLAAADNFGDIRREMDPLGGFKAELALCIHFEEAGASQANEKGLGPCGIGATLRRSRENADLPRGKETTDGLETVNNPLFVRSHARNIGSARSDLNQIRTISDSGLSDGAADRSATFVAVSAWFGLRAVEVKDSLFWKGCSSSVGVRGDFDRRAMMNVLSILLIDYTEGQSENRG